MGTQCKKCNKPNHIARMFTSQQVSEIIEATESSGKVCNLIKTFDSCEELEITSIELKVNRNDSIDRYIQRRFENKDNCQKQATTISEINKLTYADPKSESMKSLKALVPIDNQIISMAVDTVNPISFLNWSTAKKFS